MESLHRLFRAPQGRLRRGRDEKLSRRACRREGGTRSVAICGALVRHLQYGGGSQGDGGSGAGDPLRRKPRRPKRSRRRKRAPRHCCGLMSSKPPSNRWVESPISVGSHRLGIALHLRKRTRVPSCSRGDREDAGGNIGPLLQGKSVEFRPIRRLGGAKVGSGSLVRRRPLSGALKWTGGTRSAGQMASAFTKRRGPMAS